jgi:hypothetical protein
MSAKSPIASNLTFTLESFASSSGATAAEETDDLYCEVEELHWVLLGPRFVAEVSPNSLLLFHHTSFLSRWSVPGGFPNLPGLESGLSAFSYCSLFAAAVTVVVRKQSYVRWRGRISSVSY